MYNDKIVKENEQNMKRIRTTLIFQIHKLSYQIRCNKKNMKPILQQIKYQRMKPEKKINYTKGSKKIIIKRKRVKIEL